ncbi:MAG: hypothetical protein O3A03_06655 [Proteobacteria bacterium]|nr:hypothetical protein [Pseudomonadota bacterium]MDA0942534.1 hypothetical protein [Pseudomonadota bacterium]MDA1035207.1 hypothetical protein [Pseudomonadota bacterium]
MRKYILLILFPLTSVSEEITFQCKYTSDDDPSTEMNENIIYDPSKESLSVKRYKDRL